MFYNFCIFCAHVSKVVATALAALAHWLEQSSNSSSTSSSATTSSTTSSSKPPLQFIQLTLAHAPYRLFDHCTTTSSSSSSPSLSSSRTTSTHLLACRCLDALRSSDVVDTQTLLALVVTQLGNNGRSGGSGSGGGGGGAGGKDRGDKVKKNRRRRTG
jgi:hypothetical protein